MVAMNEVFYYEYVMSLPESKFWAVDSKITLSLDYWIDDVS